MLKGDDYILRVYAASEGEQEFTLRIGILNRTIADRLSGHEIKTYCIPKNETDSVREINMIEIEDV